MITNTQPSFYKHCFGAALGFLAMPYALAATVILPTPDEIDLYIERVPVEEFEWAEGLDRSPAVELNSIVEYSPENDSFIQNAAAELPIEESPAVEEIYLE